MVSTAYRRSLAGLAVALLAVSAGPSRGLSAEEGATSTGSADARAADPPASQPAEAGPVLGRIEGRLCPANAVKSIRCVDREFNLPYPVRWEAAAGRFQADKLAPDRRYDLEVSAADGRTFIGVDLGFEEDPLLRLAKRQAGAGTGDEDEDAPGPLTEDDRGQIGRIVTEVETFENERRVVQLRGDHSRAAALVELRRTTAFHSSKPGEQIRRVEVWYFKFQHGGWEKVANAERVLSRVRGPADQIDARARREVYMPELGGLAVDASGRAGPVELTLPGFEPPTTQPEPKPSP